MNRFATAAAVLALVLAGCGDDEESDSADATEVSESEATESEETDSDATDAPTPSGGEASCSVTVTGDVSAEWTSNASGFQAFVYEGWLANPSPDDQGSFGLNCFDSDFDLVGFLAEDTDIPMEPATYAVTGDGSTPIRVDVALLFDEGFWEVTSGELVIAEFDEEHISGTFTLAIEDESEPGRTAEVTGEFAHSR